MWFLDFRQLSDVIITSHPTHTNNSLFMTNGIQLPEEQRNSSCFCVIKDSLRGVIFYFPFLYVSFVCIHMFAVQKYLLFIRASGSTRILFCSKV